MLLRCIVIEKLLIPCNSFIVRNTLNALDKNLWSVFAEPKKVKVVVIGAGVAGLSAARQLKFFGCDVIVVEARVSFLSCFFAKSLHFFIITVISLFIGEMRWPSINVQKGPFCGWNGCYGYYRIRLALIPSSFFVLLFIFFLLRSFLTCQNFSALFTLLIYKIACA